MQKNDHFSPSADWNDAVRLFLQDCKSRNLTKATIRRYRNGLDKFHQHLALQKLHWLDLAPALLTHHIIPSMLEEGLSLRTVNCNLCIYKEFFKFLCGEGLAASDIGVGLKPFKLQPATAHTFTDEHLQHLFALPNRSTFTGLRNYVMMLTLLDTGIRLNELAKLQISDVLTEEASLRIVQGKGRKSRLVPIQRFAINALKRYMQERGALGHQYLWITLENEPFQAGGIRMMISRYCAAANIQGIQCSCHTFRHTFAKKYIMNGGDIFTLKSILGHERIKTTEMYVELFSRDLNIQHEKYSPIEHLAEELPFFHANEGEVRV